GRYIVAEDVGMKVEDMETMSAETAFVVGRPPENAAQAGIGGDPSPVTAYGVFQGLKAAVRHRLGASNLGDLKVAVQGLGNVGYNLCALLTEAGAKLFVTDVDGAKIDKAVHDFGATAVDLDAIYDTPMDVFA